MFSANTSHRVFVPTITPTYQYVVIGGGGGGGGGLSAQTLTGAGSGGGAGGYLAGSLNSTSDTLNITVGAGGVGDFQFDNFNSATAGGESAILINSTYLVRAFGGGRGVSGSTLNAWNNGLSGASGSGATSSRSGNRGTGGSNIAGQGNVGGLGPNLTSNRSDVGGGGGGGAGGAGGNAGISFGGGAGSGVFDSLVGFVCPGGEGGYNVNYGFNAAPSSTPGAGGNGGRFATSTITRGRAQPGANGLVVIAYPLRFLPATATGTFTYTETGGNRVYRFTGPGTIKF